jgi:FkbM family methyltransferase
MGPDVLVLANKDTVHGMWFSHDVQLGAILRKCGVNLVLDVGANHGQFAEGLREFYQGQILSFEPVSSVFSTLKQTASGDPNWQTHKLALGSRDAQETIHISAKSVFNSFLNTNEYCESRFGANATGTTEEMVKVRRLDTFLPEVIPNLDNARIFLKMDTQGYDLEVFRGLGNLRERIVALQTEVSVIPIYVGMPSWTESIRFLEEEGFGIVGLFPINREAMRIIEYDCIMISTRYLAAESVGNNNA